MVNCSVVGAFAWLAFCNLLVLGLNLEVSSSCELYHGFSHRRARRKLYLGHRVDHRKQFLFNSTLGYPEECSKARTKSCSHRKTCPRSDAS